MLIQMMMAVKLISPFNMKYKSLLLFISSLPLLACSKTKLVNSKAFYFDTFVETTLYDGSDENIKDIEQIFLTLDKLSDNYQTRDVKNVYSINQTNDVVEVDPALYGMLKDVYEIKELDNFNPLIGSLSKKWKEVLKEKHVLSNEIIQAELEKLATSALVLLSDNKVERVGEAELDLGAVAKGFALDKTKAYLNEKEVKQYLVNAGQSSILLGEKNTEDGLFSVGISNLKNAYLNLKNCVVSTSSASTQGVVIDGVTYSHIINPKTGSAINTHEAVIVVSESGYLGDALSTALVNNSIDEIKHLEEVYNVKTIVIDNSKIAYKHESLEVLYH